MTSSGSYPLRYGAEGNYTCLCGGNGYDCYLGGPCSGGKRGCGTDKAKVVVALFKMEDNIPLFAHMQVVENLQTKTLQEFIDQHYLAQGTTLQCNGFSSYKGHTGVAYDAKVFDTSNGNLKWLHKAITNFGLVCI